MSINIETIYEQITNPNVTEETLQACLQQLNTATTELKVKMRLAEEEISKMVSEDNPLYSDIQNLLKSTSIQETQSNLDTILSSLNSSIKSELAQLQTISETTASPAEKQEITNIINVFQTEVSPENIEALCQKVQNSLQNNKSAIAVQESKLQDALNNAPTVVSNEVRKDMENIEAGKEVETYQQIIEKLTVQVNANMKAYRDYQESLKPKTEEE